MGRTTRAWFRAPPGQLRRRDLVAALLPALSDAERDYQLWARGLLLTEAQQVAAGAPPPPGLTPEQLATAVAQELLAALPLLQRTGRLALLGLDARMSSAAPLPSGDGAIDLTAADDVGSLSGEDFL